MDVKIIILIIVTILSLIFGSIVSYATIIKNRKLYSILKAFPLLFLIIGFVICYPTKPILYLALIFALSGDILLIFKKSKLFYIGAVSFFISHLLFITNYFLIIDYSLNYIPLYLFITTPLLFIVLVLSFGIAKFKKLKANAFLTPIYFSGLILNFYLAINCLILIKDLAFIICIIGYLFFILSDAFIAIQKFIKTYKYHDFYIISTYYIAQILISIGLFAYMIP